MSTIYRPHRGGTTVMNSSPLKDIILPEGELFVEYPDTGVGSGKSKFKIGDGVSSYENLPYVIGDTSTDPIEFTQGSQSTIEEAINDIASGSGLDTLTGAIKQALSLSNSAINTINTVTIPGLQSNFQDAVDSIYNAIVARGTTPASKSLNDVVTAIGNIETTHTTTYSATSRASNLDMGQTHSYRYVNTNSVPNTNNGTYTFPANDTGGTKDLGTTNTYRYVNAGNVYNKGKADGKADHSATYIPTSRASNLDMGQTHSYRYVNTNSVPNTNSGTYTPTTRAASIDMGSTNSYRYVNTNSVPNTNSATYTYPANDTGGTKDLGTTNTYRYVNAGNVYNKGKADGVTIHSATYNFPANDTGGTKDLGSTHTYRYVNAGNVYNKGKADGATVHSGTYTFPANDTGGTKDLGSSHSYRYVNADNVYSKGVADGKASATVVFKQANKQFTSNRTLDDYITNTLGKNCKVYMRFRLTGNDVLIQVAGSTKWSGHTDSEGTFDLGVNQSVRFKQNSEHASNSDDNYYFVAIYG